ncbi:MAG: hypothetical protein GKR88_13835 [Flavobacteriaceae bacterium]|nr:MAG: hypothetical protein GKR88_13835 [Flavobacteriaceae bacterium]
MINNTIHLLKSYRELTGVALQDMATLIGIDTGNLSKIEHGKLEPNILVILSYHLILKIPIEKLFKYQYPETIKSCLRNSLALKDELIPEVQKPHIKKRITQIDTIIDRLVILDKEYVN